MINAPKPKCQIVDCTKDSTEIELWKIGDARAFVDVCDDHGLHGKVGSRTSIQRTSAQARRDVA